MIARLVKLLPLFAWLALPLGVLCYSLLLSPYLRRPAIEYTAATSSDHEMKGGAGEWSTLHFEWRQRRAGCVLDLPSLSIVLVDKGGLAYEVGGERGGIPLTYSSLHGVVDFVFRVPEKVPAGDATLIFSTAFQCGRWSTNSARARYGFEVVSRE